MTEDKINWPTETVADLDALVDMVGEARLLLDTGAVLLGETVDYPPKTVDAILDMLDAAITALRARSADHEAEITRLTAERDAAQADAEDWARKCAAADEMRETAWEMGRDEAAAWCADEADKCADAAKWGGHRKYVADCKAASFALRNAWATIHALTPPADMAAKIGGE